MGLLPVAGRASAPIPGGRVVEYTVGESAEVGSYEPGG
jgi:hypothetical protein